MAIRSLVGFVRPTTTLLVLALLLGACGRPGAETAATTAAPAASGATAMPAASDATAAPVAAGGATAMPATTGSAEIDCTKISSDLKIGLEGSLTGGTADYGQGMVKGFQLAIQEYNAKGGYQSKQV